MESIRQYLEGRPTETGEAVFDKEDDLAVEFVTAAANLRAANYSIPQQSLFITKVMRVCSSRLCLRNNIETQKGCISSTLGLALQSKGRNESCRSAMQGMAGNIIHAIATTNAIVGGLIVVEAMKILAGKPKSSRVIADRLTVHNPTICQPVPPIPVPGSLFLSPGTIHYHIVL